MHVNRGFVCCRQFQTASEGLCPAVPVLQSLLLSDIRLCQKALAPFHCALSSYHRKTNLLLANNTLVLSAAGSVQTNTGQLSTMAVSFMRHRTCRSRKPLGLSVGFVWNLHRERSRCWSRAPLFGVGRSQTASGRATPQQHHTCHSRKPLGSSLGFIWNLHENQVKVLVKSALTCCRQITDSFRKSYALLWRFPKVCPVTHQTQSSKALSSSICFMNTNLW